MSRPSRHPLVVASALAQATTKAVVKASVGLAADAAVGVGRTLTGSDPRAPGPDDGRGGDHGNGRHLGAAGEGAPGARFGPLQLRRRDLDWIRRQVAAGLRVLLAVPEDASERLRTADPTTMARTLLALLGGDEALMPLPTPEEQIRRRFADLLAPSRGDPDEPTLAPALLRITAQLTPDEARLLRHLATTDRAVVVDVRSTSLTSRRGPTVAANLSLLVDRAGGDHAQLGPAYIANLVRLGLCRIDREVTGDHPDIELIEQLPAHRQAVEQVRADGGRPRSVDATLRLTSLGTELLATADADGPMGTTPVRDADDRHLGASAGDRDADRSRRASDRLGRTARVSRPRSEP